MGSGRYWPRITKADTWGWVGTGRASLWLDMGLGQYWPHITKEGIWGQAGTGRASLRLVYGVGPVRFQIDPLQP